MTTRYAELFAGVGGFRLGVEQAESAYEDTNGVRCSSGSAKRASQHGRRAFHCVYASEIDKHAAAVYRHIWRGNNGQYCPELKEGDIREQSTDKIPDFDFLTAGFPCQSFSVAGNLGGFEDTRGVLFFEVARFLADRRPRHFLLENVKNLVGHDKGQTFQTILGILAGLGYRVEWQVLNSTCWVPQNRERVFIIGHLGGGCSREVFPLREDDGLYPEALGQDPVANCLDSSYWKGWLDKGQGTMVVERPHGYNQSVVKSGICLRGEGRADQNQFVGLPDDENGKPQLLPIGYRRFRRLTPTECERLQGWPDLHTAIGLYRATDLPKSKRHGSEYEMDLVSDTQRYRMTGNGVTADVVREVVRKMVLVGCFGE